MLETLTIESFADKVGDTFRIAASPTDILESRLVDVRALKVTLPDGTPRPGKREPFSIVFHAPATIALPQRIYQVSHETLGAHEIFLVPIGRRDAGLLYEAIFT